MRHQFALAKDGVRSLPSAAMIRKVLLADPDPSSQQQCGRILRDCHCEVVAVDSVAAAVAQLGNAKFDAVVVDFRLASLSGSDLPAMAKQAQPGINIILTLDAVGTPPSSQPLRLRGYALLTKPLKIEEVAQALESTPEETPIPEPAATPSKSASHPSKPGVNGFAGMVGGSERMRKIYRLISKVAVQRHAVLITGESGTGKELVAQAIHSHGPWKDKPFVPVDCGALPPTLIESELFGHVKGAFTGAAQSRQGLLATAGAGTVFLDEIGELPIELQSRLLRALQEHEIRPLGSNERVKFEARIIAATNQNLDEGIKSGKFRKDLYFRLNVVTIKVPPLRDRKEDIPELVRYFLQRYNDKQAPMEVSEQALQYAVSYEWPGNIRELENCFQRAVSLCSGKRIEAQDLPSAIFNQLPVSSPGPSDSGSLQTLEQQAIRKALERTGGDRVRAAEILGIGKTTIYRKLKEYGIEENPLDV